MKQDIPKGLADYGGALNAGLCLLHCLAGPLLLTWLGYQSQLSEAWELGFLVVSGGLVVIAGRQVNKRLRMLMAGLFGLLVLAWALHEWLPALEVIQHGAAIGLIGAHFLNLRQHRRALAASQV
jgi:hypothetical protein